MEATEMTASLSPSHRPRQQSGADHRVLNRAGLHPLPSLQPQQPLHLVAPEGQLQVHTAPYRGSFGTVLSQALRSAGLGSRVAVMQFLKGGVAQGPHAAITLCDRMVWMRPAVMGCLSDQASSADPTTVDAVQAVWQICRRHLASGDLDQLVLDELGLAIALGYLNESEVRDSLDARPGSMDVIITGPSIPDSLMGLADQVTELRRGF
ncbi:MAG: Cob(I)yrinic acid a,c-diamide adenosyltransferase [Synechococcus sp. MIT S9220]|nr:MAG: Cob(I)yrinic acid a,c-diamide adenosyltransferase [Synechococcus sp. MIT S9220]